MLLNQFLLLSAVLFAIGVYGVLARRNGVLVLMSIELILNAVNINLVASPPRSAWAWPWCCCSTATAAASTSPRST